MFNNLRNTHENADRYSREASMAQNNKINKVTLNDLSDLVVPDNWMEITGPFYHIKTESKEIKGPFHAHDITALLEITTLPDETLIKDAKNTTEWSPLYAHPAFQRRKPSIVTEISNIQASKFYYLKNGNPVGPVTPTEMEQLITDKDIISTDAISIDECQTWLKLYQIPGFDQRSYSASELPIIPEKNEDEISPINLNEDNESTQIANLVYIESRKTKDQDTVTSHTEIKSEKSSNTPLLILAAVILIALIGYISQSSTVTKNKKKIVNKNSKVLKSNVKKKSIQDKVKKVERKPTATKRNIAKEIEINNKRARSRKPKSFISTPVYKDRKKMKDNALEEDSYYDDGEGDIENDAVRKAVSKETLYPEDSEVLEPEEDIYKDEVDSLESEENEISSAEDVWGDEASDKKDSKDPFEEEY
jgi:hypothetical protein